MRHARTTSALVLLFGLVVGGCATYESPFVHKSEDELDAMEARDEVGAERFAEGDYETAQGVARELSAEPTVSRPVYQLEEISTLLMQGRREEAHALMMKVREDTEMLFDKTSEEKAVSLWHGENNKVFKGDNHERALLYAFLAMSFIERGEWDDAVRCVKNGLLADSSTDPNDAYSSDFKLLSYLGYVASTHAGDTASAEDFKRELGDVRLDAEAANANAFLVIWSGTPPSYVRGGAYHEIRHVIPGQDVLSMITVEGPNGTVVAPRGLADINFQASTRGGREMDTVLANKALVKSGMEASGNILIVAGVACLATAAANSNANAQIALLSVGCACVVAGVTFHIVGACVNPTADVRYWKNLPGSITVVPLRLPKGNTPLVLRGYHGWDNVIRETCNFDVSGTGVMMRHVSLIPQAKTYEVPYQMYLTERNAAAMRETSSAANWSRYEVTE